MLSSYDLYNTTTKNELTLIFHFIVNNCFIYIYKLPLAVLLKIITIICENPLNWLFLCKYVRLIDLQKWNDENQLNPFSYLIDEAFAKFYAGDKKSHNFRGLRTTLKLYLTEGWGCSLRLYSLCLHSRIWAEMFIVIDQFIPHSTLTFKFLKLLVKPGCQLHSHFIDRGGSHAKPFHWC